MTNSIKTLLSVAWRGMPKRAWFKREKYTYRAPGGTSVTTSPKYWHAGVDIIQVRSPNPNPLLAGIDKVTLLVRAFCGYEYTFDWYLAANQYGRAMYRDSIKTNVCPKCTAQLALPPQDRAVNTWATPATTSDMLSANQEDGPWYPSEK
ncbi:MAG: hypothetical protein RR853_09225 [Aurantimicrobium sp.]|uniref:hypothetical protein n=1 Tax=Aurantimicrobium sp. TaxID=1930784 RepID=UPI002FCBBDD6